MSASLCLGPVTTLPQTAIDLLIKKGFISPPAPAAATMTSLASSVATQPITALQGQIWHALTDRPLNDRQTLILQAYWRAKNDGEAALPVEEVARRLAAAGTVDPDRAVDYVKGALRSFGRRLFQTLDRPPVRLGADHQGDGVADEIPLLALM